MSLNRRFGKLFFLFFPFFTVFCYSFESDGAEFSLRPSITLKEEYDDNIYLTRDDKVDDYITRALPSLNANYKTPLWDWTLSYTLNWWYYAKKRKGNTSHDLNLLSKVNVVKNFLYLDISDIYQNVVVEPRRPSTESNLDVNRTDTNTLNASPYIKYQITSATAVSTGYKYINMWYRRDGINRQIHTGFINIEHTFSPLFNGIIGAEYVADRPEQSEADNNQKAIFSTAHYNVSLKTMFEGTIGYRKFDYSDGREKGRIFYNAGLTHRLIETGQVELRASSTFTYSPLYGVIESIEERFNIRRGETFLVNGGIFHRRDRYLEIDRKDDVVGVTAGFEYRTTPKLTFRVAGRHEKSKFLPAGNKRKIYDASTGMDYRLTEKTTLTLTYNYARGLSDIDVDKYINNKIAAQLRMAL